MKLKQIIFIKTYQKIFSIYLIHQINMPVTAETEVAITQIFNELQGVTRGEAIDDSNSN